ncbi:Biopolymer transport protein ExbD [Methylacidimicrobium cyclopophantes]|uniref:Biopolymer transport protein ExbD n=1 Tax=Methylacidimicrobium cyclopophantes TaxID=1041766 RepID=A0A5E6M9W4_9BACT|nr:biopolymer transporter ExbD [Methylacidimicrobium cyclopophantes]VVM05143.1 Biopolymer transport protein ExbD [Methylacidimicrobium cyclopophantes]
MKRFSERTSARGFAELNVTPMLDFAFTLLVIFLITTPLLESGIDVSLPQAAPNRRSPDPRSVQTLTVTGKGSLFWNREPITIAQLPAKVAEALRGQPDLAVAVRADRDLRYQDLVTVFDTLQAGGVPQVALVHTDEPSGDLPARP